MPFLVGQSMEVPVSKAALIQTPALEMPQQAPELAPRRGGSQLPPLSLAPQGSASWKGCLLPKAHIQVEKDYLGGGGVLTPIMPAAVRQLRCL